MRRGFQAAIFVSIAILFVVLASSFGWGENADRLVTNKAVDTLPDEMLPFFQANRQYLVQHVKRPESVRPSTAPSSSGLKLPGAAPVAPVESDFIQIDHYGPFPFTALPRDYNTAISKYNRRTLAQYGLLPWEIGVYSKKLTDAFRDHNWGDVRTDAAALAHFVIAAHDPFNTTTNFDGKISLQPGVNERFGYRPRGSLPAFLLCEDQRRSLHPRSHRLRFRNGSYFTLMARGDSACRSPRAHWTYRI